MARLRAASAALALAGAASQVVWLAATVDSAAASPIGQHPLFDNSTAAARRLTTYKPFVYGGGPVMHAPVLYPIFYGTWTVANEQILMDMVRSGRERGRC